MPRASNHKTDRAFSSANSLEPSETSVLKDSLWPLMERVEKQRNGESKVFLRTGYRDVDGLTGNFSPGDVVVIAGRPSMGKTAFALNIAANAAMDDAAAVIIFTLEGTKDSTMTRLLTSEARVDYSRLRRGEMHDDEFVRLGRAAGLMSRIPVWIDELTSRSFDEMVGKIRARRQTDEIKLVVIDYLQLLEGPLPKAENRTQELSAMSRSLKGLAKELGITIVVLSQCSRAPEQRSGENKRPFLSDIRDSGSIEEDADVVMLLYREEMYKGPVDYDGNNIEGRAEVIIGKNRHGNTGFANLFFFKSYGRFESYKRE